MDNQSKINNEARPYGYLWFNKKLERQFTHNKPDPTLVSGDVPGGELMTLYDHPAPAVQPIDMILHCPACGLQHIDAPEGYRARQERWASGADDSPAWTNPPHRSHLCERCHHTWRPADVPTNGVKTIKTKGKADSVAPDVQPSVLSDAQIRGIAACDGGGYQDDDNASWSFDSGGLLKFARALLAQPVSVPVSDEQISQFVHDIHAIWESDLSKADAIAKTRDTIEAFLPAGGQQK